METYKESVLYWSVNSSLQQAARRFRLTIEQVREIVREQGATIEIEERCPCKVSSDEGNAMMCFVCDGPMGERAVLAPSAQVLEEPTR